MYQHVLLPTDGSPFAAVGVRQGLELAKALGAKATAVVVSEPFFGVLLLPGEIEPTPSRSNEEITRASKAAAQKILSGVQEQASAMGVPCEQVNVFDRFPAADGILETARERGCDLIVMASHGRRGIRRMLLGSQALEVVTRSNIPVLIVRD